MNQNILPKLARFFTPVLFCCALFTFAQAQDEKDCVSRDEDGTCSAVCESRRSDGTCASVMVFLRRTPMRRMRPSRPSNNNSQPIPPPTRREATPPTPVEPAGNVSTPNSNNPESGYDARQRERARLFDEQNGRTSVINPNGTETIKLERRPEESEEDFRARVRAATYEAQKDTASDDPCWGEFTYLGQGISVRFCKVQDKWDDKGNSGWTWSFRNDEPTTITYLEFEYTEYHGMWDIEKQHDVFPGSLKGGKIFGGWASFLAVSNRRPDIRIIKIERK